MKNNKIWFKILLIAIIGILDLQMASGEINLPTNNREYGPLEINSNCLDNLILGNPLTGLSFSTLNENYKSTEIYRKFISAKSQNENVVGWITIPNTLTDNAIMFNKDNEFYLHRNENGEWSKNGSIFIDSTSGGKFSDINLIHGHNMKSGLMFGELDKYKDENFTKTNREFEIARSGSVDKYRIYSVFIADGNSERFDVRFDNQKRYREYFKTLGERSMFKLDYKKKDLNEIIMLNTCSYEFSNAHLIICAYREKINEE
jgi:sortase B